MAVSPKTRVATIGPKSVGYARVSSEGQDYKTQVDALRAAGCAEIYSEKKTGTTTEGRVELQRAIEACRAGDTLVIVRLDRMARSLKDLLGIMEYLDGQQIGFKCLTQPIDTTTSVGRFIVSVIGAAAEFENDLRRERQRVGIEAAKKRGVYKAMQKARAVARGKKFGVAHIRHLRYVRRWTIKMVMAEVGCSAEYVQKNAPMRLNPHRHPPTSRLSAKAE